MVARLRVELERLRAEMEATLERLQRLTESAVEGLGLSPVKPSPRCFVLSDELPMPAVPACVSLVASPPAPKGGTTLRLAVGESSHDRGPRPRAPAPRLPSGIPY